MSSPRVIALRSLQLAVTDIEASVRFYRDVWALEALPEDAADPEARRFRASGAEHHVLTLRKAARPGLRLAATRRQTDYIGLGEIRGHQPGCLLR